MLENLKRYYLKYIVSFLIALMIVVINNWAKGSFTSIYNYLDGTFIAGASFLCIGGLSACACVGAFDVFTYMGARRGPNGVKPSMYEHSEMLKEKRKKHPKRYIPYFVIGGLFLIVSLILFCFI